MPNTIASKSAAWWTLPDSLLFTIFSNLKPRSLLRASQVNKQWYRVAVDEFLWKELFFAKFKVDRKSTVLPPTATSWRGEFIRLYDHTPAIESEVFKEHKDQVLHVSFSNNGRYFATSSKDGFIKVWEVGRQTYVKYYEDMGSYNWRYTQYSEFNHSDTLLLVSGVHFGPHSTSGEIAVFNLEGGFALQCTVRNKPYDIFGTWYNDDHLLSGNLHWLGNLSSCSVIYLNKSSQDLENIYESVVMQLFKFRNVNASSIRNVMVCDVVDINDYDNDFPHIIKRKRIESDVAEACVMETNFDDANELSEPEKPFSDAWSDIAVSSDVIQQNEQAKNGAVQQPSLLQDSKWLEPSTFHEQPPDVQAESGPCNLHVHADDATCNRDTPAGETSADVETSANKSNQLSHESEITTHPLPCRYGRGGACSNGLMCPAIVKPKPEVETDLTMLSQASALASIACGAGNFAMSYSKASGSRDSTATSGRDTEADKYLIFTTGNQTFTPHQIGIKRIRHSDALGKMSKQAEQRRLETYRLQQRLREQAQRRLLYGNDVDAADGVVHYNGAADDDDDDDALFRQMDAVDCVIEMQGHIIGTRLSPDGRRHHERRVKRRLHSQHKAPSGSDARRARVDLPHDAELASHSDDGDDVTGEDDTPGVDLQLDSVDCVMDMHGQVIGMSLSPDGRYLYVNLRTWPKRYVIADPMEPPPIAQQIEVHVIDLCTLTDLGAMHTAHKAFTPNDECFFVFLDVCDDYVASGAEDKHGYIWDRHYGILLNRFKHTDVVNSVAFHPRDRETLVTVSDDNTVKIWRSRNRCRELGFRLCDVSASQSVAQAAEQAPPPRMDIKTLIEYLDENLDDDFM